MGRTIGGYLDYRRYDSLETGHLSGEITAQSPVSKVWFCFFKEARWIVFGDTTVVKDKALTILEWKRGDTKSYVRDWTGSFPMGVENEGH